MILNSPVVDIVEQLIVHALELSASDIHLEPENDELKVRFRIDGILYNKSVILNQYACQVISRIKVLSNMNVAEKRLPQDGKFVFQCKSNFIDLRTSTFPTVNGEKVVIRLLGNFSQELNIDVLGFDNEILENIKNISQLSSGLFLVTGPTGSGKTTTLHAMINLVNKKEKNITTLEEPVEYYIAGVSQANVNNQIGFTFEAGVKALLRQDPDVIMVGEIRDKETAQVAIQAALTGHLVLSTLHTNNAVDTIIRLLDMEVEPFLINSALSAVLAQRLVRKLCDSCKVQRELNIQEKELALKLNLKIDQAYMRPLGISCRECSNIGYKGRTGIFELMIINSGIRSFIKKNLIYKEIYKQAYINGFRSFADDAMAKIDSGITDLYEIFRVLG